VPKLKSASSNRFGSIFAQVSNRQDISRKASFSAAAGAGNSAGRFKALPSACVNSALVTGVGAEALKAPAGVRYSVFLKNASSHHLGKACAGFDQRLFDVADGLNRLPICIADTDQPPVVLAVVPDTCTCGPIRTARE